MPDGWRLAISTVVGMEEINAAHSPPRNSEYVKGTVLTVDTIELNSVNAAGFTAYSSGGILQYNTPVDLAGFTAEMDIRSGSNSTTTLYQLSTAGGQIALDNVLKTITLTIPASDTEDFTWTTGVYDLEMTSGGGIVTRLLSGNITVSREVTKV
jgi:hypothetical protein